MVLFHCRMGKKKRYMSDPLKFLESCWPGKPSKEVREAFARLKKCVKVEEPKEVKAFRVLDIVRRSCATHDFLFLSRQLTYHIAAHADLNDVKGNGAQIEAVLSEIIGHIVRRVPRGGRIDIEVKEACLRREPAVEVVFRFVDEKLGDTTRAAYIDGLFGAKSASPVLACKEAILKEGGQLTVDLPEPKRPLFRIALRTVASVQVPTADHVIFKYDISIRNMASVRKRFGIKKSESLVAQIEEFVRSLVRHPVDIVTAARDKGVITAIYETQKGAANSVASRISARLGSEKFLIGKLTVDLNFHYHLSALPSVPLRSGENTERR